MQIINLITLVTFVETHLPEGKNRLTGTADILWGEIYFLVLEGIKVSKNTQTTVILLSFISFNASLNSNLLGQPSKIKAPAKDAAL